MAGSAGDAAESSTTKGSIRQWLVFFAALDLPVECRAATTGGAVRAVGHQRAIPELRVRGVPHRDGRTAAWGDINSSGDAYQPPAFAQRGAIRRGVAISNRLWYFWELAAVDANFVSLSVIAQIRQLDRTDAKPDTRTKGPPPSPLAAAPHGREHRVRGRHRARQTQLPVAQALERWRDGHVDRRLQHFYEPGRRLGRGAALCVFASDGLNSTSDDAGTGSQSEPESSQVVEFYGATGLYFVLFACIVHAVPTAVLASRRVVGYSENRTTRPQGFRRALVRTLVSTWHVLVLAIAAGTAFMVLMALEHVPFREYGRLHVYIMCAIAYAYALFADFTVKAARRLRAQEIRESLRTPPFKSKHHLVSAQAAEPQRVAPATEVPGTPMTTAVEINSHTQGPTANPKSAEPRGVPTRPSLAARHSSHSKHARSAFMHIVAFNVVFLYLHVASMLKLTKQWELLLFASMSLLLKISIPEAAKRFQLSAQRNPSVRAVHLVMTVPTIAIDAQIRMVFIQDGGGQSTVASSIATVFCEIFFRIAKILRLRYSITARLAECKGMQRILKRVNLKLAVRNAGNARAEYAEFLNWKNHALRLHAAEVYVDTHAEYISIGMSTAVVIFMGDHPMFDLSSSTSRESGRTPDRSQRTLAAMFQMVTGLAFDCLSSVVEGVHEIPLYESIADEGASLRVFLHVLLSTLTAVNVSIIGLFYIKSF